MRERILTAAIACFERSGFHASSMQEICAEAKMSPGALYRYFPSKDAIIEAIAELERERNRQLLQQLDQAQDNILSTFLDVGFAYMREMAAGRAALCSEVFAEAQRNPRIRAIFERNDREARASIRRALERASAAGEIDSAADLDVLCCEGRSSRICRSKRSRRRCETLCSVCWLLSQPLHNRAIRPGALRRRHDR
jgi:TetR/AcrR family transcriptional regulator, repressor for uid operon